MARNGFSRRSALVRLLRYAQNEAADFDRPEVCELIEAAVLSLCAPRDPARADALSVRLTGGEPRTKPQRLPH